MINFDFDTDSAIQIIYTFSKMIGFGGLSGVDWVKAIVSLFLGGSILAYIIRNIQGVAGVASTSMFEGIWQGMSDPEDNSGVDRYFDFDADDEDDRRLSARDRAYYEEDL